MRAAIIRRRSISCVVAVPLGIVRSNAAARTCWLFGMPATWVFIGSGRYDEVTARGFPYSVRMRWARSAALRRLGINSGGGMRLSSTWFDHVSSCAVKSVTPRALSSAWSPSRSVGVTVGPASSSEERPAKSRAPAPSKRIGRTLVAMPICTTRGGYAAFMRAECQILVVSSVYCLLLIRPSLYPFRIETTLFLVYSVPLNWPRLIIS